jgi:hypothetical protein
MTEQSDTYALALLEKHVIGVLAEVERNRMNREQALPMIMKPLKLWLSGDKAAAVADLESTETNWEEAVNAHRT